MQMNAPARLLSSLRSGCQRVGQADCFQKPASEQRVGQFRSEILHRSFTFLVLLVLLLLLLLAGCRTDATVAADQPIPIRVRIPRWVRQPLSTDASGTVEANVTAQGAFQVPGRVASVLVDEGQQVARGQILAELDSADYRNARDAAAAQADQARATNQKAQAGLRTEELEEARIDFERWQDEYARMKFLYDHQSLPANDFHKVEAGYQAAAEKYEMARQGTRGEDKEAAAAQLRAAVAQMHEAGKRLADCQLRAPIAGYVGTRRIDVGDSVAAGVPVIEVLDLDPVRVRVGIPEAEIGQVREGEHATVIIPALGNRAFEGRVDAVGVAADPASRTYTLKIAVPNPEHLLKAGMVAEARIFSPVMVNAMTLPGSAIVHDQRGSTEVFIYEPSRQRVYARRVEIGEPVDNEVEIRSGLAGNEQVVVAGQQNVREGSPVKLEGGGF